MTGSGTAAAADRQHTARVTKNDPTGNGTGTTFTLTFPVVAPEDRA